MNINAAMFSVLVQTKLLFTAIFAYIVLLKKLKYIQLISLVLLTVGVMLCNISNMIANAANSTTNGGDSSGDPVKGIIATIGIAVSSGFASVYTEKVIKSGGGNASTSSTSASTNGTISTGVDTAIPMTTTISGSTAVAIPPGSDTTIICTTNNSTKYGLAYTQVQLSLMSLLTIGLYAILMDWNEIMSVGLFYNFTGGALVSVAFSAMGGLLVAAVLKYADSVLKGYATAMSVVLTGILSMLLFHTQLSTIYFMGIINVVIAVLLYNGKDMDQLVC